MNILISKCIKQPSCMHPQLKHIVPSCDPHFGHQHFFPKNQAKITKVASLATESGIEPIPGPVLAFSLWSHFISDYVVIVPIPIPLLWRAILLHWENASSSRPVAGAHQLLLIGSVSSKPCSRSPFHHMTSLTCIILKGRYLLWWALGIICIIYINLVFSDS